ncbi:MAG: PAS domain S-box protein [Candidatus Aminicenantales bacterium]
MSQNKISVLLIEDNPVDAQFICEMLAENKDYSIYLKYVESLNAGLRCLDAGPYDVVLLDLGLPDSQGIKTLLRVMVRNVEIPVIVMTGSDDQDLAIEAMRKGARDYLIKGQITSALLFRAIRYSIERRQVEKSLQETEERYRDLVEKARIAILISDNEGRFIYFNKTFAAMFGYSSDEMKGKSLASIVHPDDIESVMNVHHALQQSGHVSERSEFKGIRKDGSIVYCEMDAMALKERKKIIGTHSYIWDITERKKLEKSIYFSESMYRRLFESAKDGLLILDADTGQIIDVNPFLVNLLGFSYEELLGRKLWEISSFKDVEARPAEFRQLKNQEHIQYKDFPLETKDGQKVEVEFVSQAYFVNHKKVIQCNIRDVREHKREQEAFSESERNLRLLAENMRDAVFIYDMNRRLQYVNPAVENLTGYSPKELYKQNFILYIHPEDQQRMMKKWDELFQGGAFSNEEFRIVTKGGKEKWCSGSWGPLLDEKGNQIGIQGREIDITERKIAEEKLSASLREKEVLLKEIHHRVKNNMQIISSLLRLQSQSFKDKKTIEMFKASQNRIRTLALVYEKLHHSKDLARIIFSDYLSGLMTHLFAMYGSSEGNVRFKIQAKDIYLDMNKANPCALIINELVSNSLRHAFPNRRKGEVGVMMSVDKNGKYTLIVKDTGVGLPQDVDIRNPRSLGLQIVMESVNQLDGSIELRRKKGTEFKIEFKSAREKGIRPHK